MIAKRRVFLVIVAWILAFSMCATAFATGTEAESGANDAPAADTNPAEDSGSTTVFTMSLSDAEPAPEDKANATPDSGDASQDPADDPADPDDPDAGVNPEAPTDENLSGDGYETDSGFAVSQNENLDDSADGAAEVQSDTVIEIDDAKIVLDFSGTITGITDKDGNAFTTDYDEQGSPFLVDGNGNPVTDADGNRYSNIDEYANALGVFDRYGYQGGGSVHQNSGYSDDMIEELLEEINGEHAENPLTKDDLSGKSSEELQALLQEAYGENYDDVMDKIAEGLYGTNEDGTAKEYNEDELLKILTVVVGDLRLGVNKTAAAVVGENADGELVTEGYTITLSVEGEGDLDVLAALEGEIVGNGSNTKDIILVLDGSQSMESNGWSVLKASVNSFIDTLVDAGVDAQITVVMYSADAGTLGTFDIGKNEDGTESEDLKTLRSYFDGNDNRSTVRQGIIDHGYKGYIRDNDEDAAAHTQEEIDQGKAIGVTDAAAFAETFNANPQSSGTNTHAGYLEATAAIQRLQAAGQLEGDVSVVFMTDGLANRYVDNNGKVVKGAAGDGDAVVTSAASDAILTLLQQNDGNVTLHNIALTDKSQDSGEGKMIRSYMDPSYTGSGYSGSYKTLREKLTEAGRENQVDYLAQAEPLVWANDKEDMMETYTAIAESIALEISQAARVAKEAYVIDVIPAGFEVRIDPKDKDNLILVGEDAEGNTIIQWNVGDILDGADPQEITYFVVPENDTQYGTLFTNDSAILFAKPLGSDEEVAVVMPRPAVTVQPKANPDMKSIYYSAQNVGNLMSGDGFDIPGADSGADDRVQALGTNVDTEFQVVGIRNVTVNVGDGAINVTDVVENADGSFTVNLGDERGTVTIDRYGNVSYAPAEGKEWDPAWAGIQITFDYDIEATGAEGDVDLVDAEGDLTFTASSNAIINIAAAPAPISDEDPDPNPNPDPDPDPRPRPTPTPEDNEPIPLGVPGAPAAAEPIPLGVPGAEPIPLGAPEPIPLGVPGTGGMSMTPIAIVTLLIAISLTGWAILSKKREEN